MTRLLRAGLLAALACAPLAAQAPVAVQGDSAALPQAPAGAPVVLGSDTLFELYGRVGPFTARERAAAVERRLLDLVRNPSLDVSEVTAVADGSGYTVVAGDVVVMTVTPDDATGAGRPLDQLALDIATEIDVALAREIEAFSMTSILLGLVYSALATLALILVLRLFSRVFPTIYRILAGPVARRGAIVLQGHQLVSASRVGRIAVGAARLVRAALTLVLLYLYLPLVLSFFPWTRRLSGEIIGWVTGPIRLITAALLGYLPSLFFILVILAVTYYSTKLIKQFFLAIEAGAFKFEGFYPEWARPTYKLVRLLVIALALIMVWPYLPNSDSAAFRGVAAFIGLLITFGSAGTISNVVGGVMLTYMRAFRIGDRVKIADTVGDVVGQDLLVTRVRTIRNVDITIPNSLVLGSHIVNWSTMATGDGVILNTTVTIGYDVPWRRVHELLIAAARSTPLVVDSPAPFVHQTSLNDFHVSYELNAFTRDPGRMASIYSDLHARVQDTFAEAGVEIMSPHYAALRDGNEVTLPSPAAGDAMPPAG